MFSFPALLLHVGLIAFVRATIVTDYVYLDISIDHIHAGTIQLGLFGRMARNTVRSFIQLSTDGASVAGRRKHYVGTKFDRVVPNLLIEGGDCGAIDSPDLSLDHVVSGPVIPFEVPGLISMSSTMDNNKGCQFFVTLYQVAYLTGKYVPFGKVVNGMELVERISELSTGAGEHPLKTVQITSARHTTVQHPYFVQLQPAQGVMFWVKFLGMPLFATALIGLLFRKVIKNMDIADSDFDEIARKQLMEKKLIDRKHRNEHSDMPKKEK